MGDAQRFANDAKVLVASLVVEARCSARDFEARNSGEGVIELLRQAVCKVLIGAIVGHRLERQNSDCVRGSLRRLRQIEPQRNGRCRQQSSCRDQKVAATCALDSLPAGDVGNQPVTVAADQRYVAGVVAVVAQRMSQQLHTLRDGRVTYDGAVPDVADEFVNRQRPGRCGCEGRQQVERQLRKLDFPSAAHHPA